MPKLAKQTRTGNSFGNRQTLPEHQLILSQPRLPAIDWPSFLSFPNFTRRATVRVAGAGVISVSCIQSRAADNRCLNNSFNNRFDPC